MDVKVLSFNLNVNYECAEQQSASYLRLGYKIKGQSESGDGFIHYTLVYGKPSPYDVKRHHAYGVATC